MNEVLCQQLPVDTIVDDQTLRTWLEEQSKTYKLRYLLAHAEDGIIWGRFDEDKLTTAESAFPGFPTLRLLTLQQCRVFGESGEVLLWHENKGWRSRWLSDNAAERIEEKQILWGTKGQENQGFTLLSDGQQGLKHAVPLTDITFDKDKKKLHRPVRLLVYHYIDYADTGVARIFLSRLVSIESETVTK